MRMNPPLQTGSLGGVPDHVLQAARRQGQILTGFRAASQGDENTLMPTRGKSGEALVEPRRQWNQPFTRSLAPYLDVALPSARHEILLAESEKLPEANARIRKESND